MRKLLNILEACLLVGKAAALIALLFALADMVAIEQTVKQRLPSIFASAQSAAQKLASASDTLAVTAKRENSYIGQTSRELNKTVANAHDLLVHTDVSLNGRSGRGGILPAASALLAQQQSELTALEARAALALTDLDSAELNAQPILASLDQAAENVNRTAGDRRVAETLQLLNRAVGEADATLANLQAISASGNRDAQMIEKRLRQALKPAGFVKSALLRALGIAAPAAQIAASAR